MPLVRSLDFLADVEFEFPAAAVAGDAPELEHAGFSDDAFERDGTTSEVTPLSKATSMGKALEGVAVIFDEVAGLVVLARGAGEEANRGLSDDEAEFARRCGFPCPPPSRRDDGKRFERAGNPGCSAWRFRRRCSTFADAATDADAAAGAGHSVQARRGRRHA